MECSSEDYPAAHSMDTSWFAIDEAGHVAVFDSGEDGAVPFAALSLGGAGNPDPEAEQILGLLQPGHDDDRWDALHEGGPFFHYRNGDYGDPGHYARTDHAPTPAANIASLPATLRAKMLRLPVDFTTAMTVHLADFMADEDASTWGDTTLRGEPLTTSHPAASSSRSGLGWLIVIVLALAAALLVVTAR